MGLPSFNGVTYNAGKRYLDIDFQPPFNSPAFYEYLAYLHTYADLSIEGQPILDRLTNANYFGNAIESTLFESSAIGSQYLYKLGSRLLGSDQISKIREEIIKSIQPFSPTLELVSVQIVPDYKTGEVRITIRVYDSSINETIQAVL